MARCGMMLYYIALYCAVIIVHDLIGYYCDSERALECMHVDVHLHVTQSRKALSCTVTLCSVTCSVTCSVACSVACSVMYSVT